MTYSSFGEGTFNSTLFLQNTTQLLFICTDTAENLYYWLQLKIDQFPTWNDLFLGFLQNLLGNAIRLKYINDKVQELQDEEEENPGVDVGYKYWYYVGSVARIMLVFDPVAE